MSQKIIDKIITKTKIPHLLEVLVDNLSLSELQSLLLKIYDAKTRKRNLKTIFHDYLTIRFSAPSDIDPIVHRKLELKMFSLLPGDFDIIDLSPLAPLGTTSILTTVHQNNVISTIRNVEVAADTTNILALECAKRRKELLHDKAKCDVPVKLCSSQRITRGQSFENKNFSAYFNVIALCSAGKDTGNDTFEMTHLQDHIKFYIHSINQIIDSNEIKEIVIKFYSYEGFENKHLIESINSICIPQKNISIVTEDYSTFGKNYYTRLRFMISVINQNNDEFAYIDGGFTDWTSKLLNNNKERLLTSGIGTDFLLRTATLNSLNLS